MARGKRWNPNERAVLERMYERGDPIAEIAAELKRSPDAVKTRVTRAGLKRPERVTLSAAGHPLPVRFELETVERIDRQGGRRSPYVRRAVDLQLAVDEAGIEETPAEIVALLRAALAPTVRAKAKDSRQL